MKFNVRDAEYRHRLKLEKRTGKPAEPPPVPSAGTREPGR